MRVTIDLDEPSELMKLKTLFNLIYFTGRTPEVKISSSGKGLHYIVRGLKITYNESLILRMICNDDINRVRFDTQPLYSRFKPRQILWTWKRKNGRTFMSERISIENLLSLPFKSLIPRGVYKCSK